MWYEQTDFIILAVIPFVVGSILYQFKVAYHFKYLKLGYDRFQDYDNFLQYELKKLRNVKRDLNDTMAISFPFFSRDKFIEENNPTLKNLGTKIIWLSISIWVILIYLFSIGFHPKKRELIVDFLTSVQL